MSDTNQVALGNESGAAGATVMDAPVNVPIKAKPVAPVVAPKVVIKQAPKQSFAQYMVQFQSLDTAEGKLAKDMATDETSPDYVTQQDWLEHLALLKATPEAVKVFNNAWVAYIKSKNLYQFKS